MSGAGQGTRALVVGLVFLVSLALLAGGIWTLGESSRLWSKKEKFFVMFNNVQGLNEGSAVSVAGFTIGKVTRISLPEDITEGLVRIDLAVARSNLRYVRVDSRARIKTIGLLGDKYIDLSPGTPKAAELAPGSEIEAVQPPNFDAMLSQGESVADNLVFLTTSMRTILDKINKGEGFIGSLMVNTPEGQKMTADIHGALDALRSLSRKADSGQGIVATLLNDRRAGSDLRGALRSIAATATALESGDGLLPRLLADPELARGFFDDLDETARQLKEVSARLNNERGLLARLTNDEAYADELFSSLRETSTAMSRITRRIEEGEGTLGKLIHDETLYRGLNDILAGASKSLLTRWFIGRSQKSGAEQRMERGPTPGK